MQIKDLFKKPIDRNINAVVFVDNTEEELIVQELEEYIVTNELNQHFRTFFNQLEKEEQEKNWHIGVWIAWLFWSWKSHFLKMLWYLLTKNEIKGKIPSEYFVDKFNWPDLYASLKGYIDWHDIDVIIFDAGTKASKWVRTFSELCIKALFEKLWLASDQPWLAYQEWQLIKEGIYNEFKSKYQEIAWTDWEIWRKKIWLKSTEAEKALVEVWKVTEDKAKEFFSWAIQQKEYDKKTSPEWLKLILQEYLSTKKSNHRVFFMIDEVSLYMWADSELILNLQTVEEQLATLKWKVWLAVTSQEALDALWTINAVWSKDISKLKDRFDTSIKLTSTNADEVLQKRLLDKKDEVLDELARIYQANKQDLINSIEFNNSPLFNNECYKDDVQFQKLYPVLPYQIPLVKEALEQVSIRGQVWSNFSNWARNLIRVFHSAIIDIMGENTTKLIPFDVTYDVIKSDVESYIVNIIDDAERDDRINSIWVRILKILFLLKGSDKFKLNIENLAVLLIDSMDANIVDMRRKVWDALDTLVRLDLVSKRATDYEFLTNEEKDMERAINGMTIQESEILWKVYDYFYEEIIRDRSFQYDRYHSYDYSKSVNSYVKTSSDNSNLKFHICTKGYFESIKPQIGFGSYDTYLVLDVDDSDEARTQQNNPLWCLEQHLKIAAFLRRNSDNSKDVLARKTVKSKEADELYTRAKSLLEEAAQKWTYYMWTEEQKIQKWDIRNLSLELLKKQFEHVYSLFKQLPTSRDDVKTILKISKQKALVWDDLESAHDTVLRSIQRESAKKIDVTLDRLYEEFKQPAFWRSPLDIECLVAKLWASKKIILKYEGKEIEYDNDDLVERCLTNKDDKRRLKIEPKVEIDTADTNEIIDIFSEIKYDDKALLSALDERDADAIKSAIFAWKHDRINHIDWLESWFYRTPRYPWKPELLNYKELLNDVINTANNTSELFAHIKEHKQEFIEQSKKYSTIDTFLSWPQIKIFDEGISTKKKIDELWDNIWEVKETYIKLDSILKDSSPYKEIPNITKYKNELDEYYNKFVSGKVESVIKDIEKIWKEIESTYKTSIEIARPNIEKAIKDKEEIVKHLTKYSEVLTQSAQLGWWHGELINTCETEKAKLENANKPVEQPTWDWQPTPEPIKKNLTKTVNLNKISSRTTVKNADDINRVLDEIKEKLEKEIEDGSIVIFG